MRGFCQPLPPGADICPSHRLALLRGPWGFRFRGLFWGRRTGWVGRVPGQDPPTRSYTLRGGTSDPLGNRLCRTHAQTQASPGDKLEKKTKNKKQNHPSHRRPRKVSHDLCEAIHRRRFPGSWSVSACPAPRSDRAGFEFHFPTRWGLAFPQVEGGGAGCSLRLSVAVETPVSPGNRSPRCVIFRAPL